MVSNVPGEAAPAGGRLLLDVAVPSELHFVRRVCAWVRRSVERHAPIPVGEHVLSRIETALAEAITNAMTHANHLVASRPVRVRAVLEGRRLTLEVHDTGEGFDPSSVREPAEGHLVEHGRGILTIRKCMDGVSSARTEAGHVLIMQRAL